MTPEQHAGKTANLIIFLGILYSALNLVALLGNTALARRGYGLPGLGIALVILGLGYGIRYGSMACLYTATGLFGLLAGASLVLCAWHRVWYLALRAILSGWAWFVLWRTVPAMRVLRQTGSTPVKTSRYGEFFLRRWRQQRKG